jgi:hypothetical protein
MSLLEKLAINRKVTAFFVDGTSKMNLGVKSVVDLLNGTDRVPVQIAPLKRAERLLTNLAQSAGRTVHKAEDGVFLVQPGVEVPSDPEPASELVPVTMTHAEMDKLAADMPGPSAKRPAPARKYATLSRTFFNGSPMGQVLSIYKTRETNPAKWADYRAAIANGDCVLPSGSFAIGPST